MVSELAGVDGFTCWDWPSLMNHKRELIGRPATKRLAVLKGGRLWVTTILWPSIDR
jgi:hypothetical protein